MSGSGSGRFRAAYVEQYHCQHEHSYEGVCTKCGATVDEGKRAVREGSMICFYCQESVVEGEGGEDEKWVQLNGVVMHKKCIRKLNAYIARAPEEERGGDGA